MGETLDVSDHYPIIITMPTFQHQQKKQEISCRNTKDMDIENVLSDFKKAFDEISQSTDLGFKDNYMLYESLTRGIVDKHAPLVS